jgi:tetrahydromethanopterin S-methyltransferase subunit G
LRADVGDGYSLGVDSELRDYLDTFRNEIHQRFATVDQRFDGIDQRFDGIDLRLDGIDRRFDGIDQRFDGIDLRLDGIDRRFDGIDRRLDGVDVKIDSTFAEVMHQFHVTVEGFRHQLQIVAEGVVMNAEALSRFRAEFIAEIHEIRRGR